MDVDAMITVDDHARLMVEAGVTMYRTILEDDHWHPEDALRCALAYVIHLTEERLH